LLLKVKTILDKKLFNITLKVNTNGTELGQMTPLNGMNVANQLRQK
jgi:hypothetical protein